jgi:hypothetical protein
LVRTVWFAGFLLLLLLSLLAIKMIFGTATDAAADDQVSDATAALALVIPGENTLTDADRGIVAPDADDTPPLPVESSAVRSAHAEFRPSSTTPKRVRVQSAALKPRTTGAKPMTAADAKACRQLDPIARFLIASNLAPPCAG